jgi:hypothetical protein
MAFPDPNKTSPRKGDVGERQARQFRPVMKDNQNPANLASSVAITILTNFRGVIGVGKAVSPNNWWKPWNRFKMAIGGTGEGNGN